MGAIWLLHLPWWIEEAGLEVDTWPGWETRSRSSGGYDAIHAIGVHHTAGGGDLDGNARWCWENASYRPVGAMLLDPQGRVRVGAAGATNTQGKGGPFTNSKGQVTPLDAGNRYWVSIEAINRGDGSPWPEAQQEAYVRLCQILCRKLGLDPTWDVQSHFEWTTRKIDPAGASKYATGGNKWDMTKFRTHISGIVLPPPPPPSGGGDYGLYPLDKNKPTLRRGQGPADKVRYLQDVLTKEAGKSIDISGGGYGTFGPQTEAAVKSFQSDNGVVADGIVGWDGSGTAPGPNATWPLVDALALGSEPEPPPPPPPVDDSPEMFYVVRDGQTIWSISNRLYASGAGNGNSDAVVAANGGQNIKVGQKLLLPGKVKPDEVYGIKTVAQGGDSFWAIAERIYAEGSINSNTDALLKANGGNATIHPGQTISVPGKMVR